MVLLDDTLHRRPRMAAAATTTTAAAAAVSQALARMRREPFVDLRIARHVDQLCREAAHVWRDTLLTPLVTLRLFVLQVLQGNTSITHLHQLGGVDFAPASY